MGGGGGLQVSRTTVSKWVWRRKGFGLSLALLHHYINLHLVLSHLYLLVESITYMANLELRLRTQTIIYLTHLENTNKS